MLKYAPLWRGVVKGEQAALGEDFEVICDIGEVFREDSNFEFLGGARRAYCPLLHGVVEDPASQVMTHGVSVLIGMFTSSQLSFPAYGRS